MITIDGGRYSENQNIQNSEHIAGSPADACQRVMHYGRSGFGTDGDATTTTTTGGFVRRI
jgi:hypothetical protein